MDDMVPSGCLNPFWVVRIGFDSSVVEDSRELVGGVVVIKPVHCDNLGPEPDVPVVVPVVAKPDCIGQLLSCGGSGMLVVVDNSVDLLGQPVPVKSVTMDVVAGVLEDSGQDEGWMDPLPPCYIKDDVLLVPIE